MTTLPAAVAPIDLWIAGTMRDSTDLDSRLAAAGLTRQVVKQFASELDARGLRNALDLARGTVISLLGTPRRNTEELISYDLTLWPSHSYEWSVDSQGRVTDKGFSLRQEQKFHRLALEFDVVRTALRPWHHTMNEAAKTLGPPRATDGWWPEQNLYYGPLADGQDLILTFDHALLASLTTGAHQDGWLAAKNGR